MVIYFNLQDSLVFLLKKVLILTLFGGKMFKIFLTCQIKEVTSK